MMNLLDHSNNKTSNDLPLLSNPSIHGLKGVKRYWGDINVSMDQKHGKYSTACSSSSSMTMNLDLELHLSSDKYESPHLPAAPNGSKTKQEFDLNLSPSEGTTESVLTNMSTMESSVLFINPLPKTDNGSNFCSSEITSTLPLAQNSHSEASLVDPEISPTTLSMSLQRNANMKICQVQGCEKGARGASGFCIGHGGGRRCQKTGCCKGAEGSTIYCKTHGGGRRCEFLGCTKSAEGRTDYCIGHGGGRRCGYQGCGKASRGKTGLCIRHGGGKRCIWENCTKSAEGKSCLCISHGGGRRCQYTGCTKGAQGSTYFCKAHGGGRRCSAPECKRGAEGSTLFCKGHGGGKRCLFQGGGVCPKSVHGGTQFCVAHNGGKRCVAVGCTKSARGRTEFCVRHGGGKRCQSMGCGKSAQGRTDFCKAHGGGRRCSWGRGGVDGGSVCDRSPMGRSGLCAMHAALVQDHCVHGGGTLAALPINLDISTVETDIGKSVSMASAFSKTAAEAEASGGEDSTSLVPSFGWLQEGRVHGGGLLAFLTSSDGHQ